MDEERDLVEDLRKLLGALLLFIGFMLLGESYRSDLVWLLSVFLIFVGALIALDD